MLFSTRMPKNHTTEPKIAISYLNMCLYVGIFIHMFTYMDMYVNVWLDSFECKTCHDSYIHMRSSRTGARAPCATNFNN